MPESIHTSGSGVAHRDAEGFVKAFEAFWADRALDGLDAILDDDIVLRAPLTPSTLGLRAAKRAFAGIFRMIPDLHTEVDRWAETADGVLIEFRLIGTLGGRPIEWPAVDRFVLRDGIATERVSYYDPTKLVVAILTRPASWPSLLRARIESAD